jgi:hypothetical protein
VPRLDLQGKKKEVKFLLGELRKDLKRSFIKDRSNKDELLAEIIDTLVNWLNDIWSVVYEYSVNFARAHSCLLFIADVLDQLDDTQGGCAVIHVVFSFFSFILIPDVNARYSTWLWTLRSSQNQE